MDSEREFAGYDNLTGHETLRDIDLKNHNQKADKTLEHVEQSNNSANFKRLIDSL